MVSDIITSNTHTQDLQSVFTLFLPCSGLTLIKLLYVDFTGSFPPTPAANTRMHSGRMRSASVPCTMALLILSHQIQRAVAESPWKIPAPAPQNIIMTLIKEALTSEIQSSETVVRPIPNGEHFKWFPYRNHLTRRAQRAFRLLLHLLLHLAHFSFAIS